MEEHGSYEYLKELALIFKESQNQETFMKIVELVNRLLYKLVHKARRSKPYLKRVDIQDLYSTALLGLFKAVLKVKEDQPGIKLISDIVGYVGNEIAKDNKKTNKVTFPFSIAEVALQVHLYSNDMPQSQKYLYQIENKLVDSEPVYKELEMNFLRDRFETLIAEGIISFEEFEMLTMRFVNDMSFEEIAIQMEGSDVNAAAIIESTLNKLRYEFRKRDWDGDAL